MRLEQDYYEVLGVPPDASGDEIKRAFRFLARRLHPDVAPTSDGAFHDVVAAYEVLSNAGRRLLYDRSGIGGRPLPAARTPTVAPLEVSLEWYEAAGGVAKGLEFEEMQVCSSCDGAGVARGVVPAECIRCRGSGHLSSVRESRTARLLHVRTCPVCGGVGHAPAPTCARCGGSGRAAVRRTIRVRFPAGVRDGDLVQVDGIERRFHVAVAPRPRDSRVLLGIAALALLCALVLLLVLLVR
jgi:molecular chaperone DnaJ